MLLREPRSVETKDFNAEEKISKTKSNSQETLDNQSNNKTRQRSLTPYSPPEPDAASHPDNENRNLDLTESNSSFFNITKMATDIQKLEQTSQNIKTLSKHVAYRETLLHWRIFAILGYCFIWGCSSALYVLLPKYVQNKGIRPQQTATLFMIGGITSFGARVLIAVTGSKLVYNVQI